MNWRRIVSDYFSFSRKERTGIYVLLVIIAATTVLPFFFSNRTPMVIQPLDSTWSAVVSKLEQQNEPEPPGNQTGSFTNREKRYPEKSLPTPTLFYFDPNTISLREWEKLGLPGRVFQTIDKYRSKGGKFRSSDDLKKIYGLKAEDFDRVAAYIRIAENQKAPVRAFPSHDVYQPRFNKTYTSIDINDSDTTAWIQLPGIGNRLASRIISFREKLGGFCGIEQVGETYGLPDSVFQKIKPYLLKGATELRKININTATWEQLKDHPYIRSAIASAIINYRKEHGVFNEPAELKKIMAVTDELFKKISPYISVK